MELSRTMYPAKREPAPLTHFPGFPCQASAPASTQTSHGLAAFLQVALRQRMRPCTSPLDGLHDAEAAPPEYLAQRSHRAPGLAEPNAEGPRRSAGDHQQSPLPLVQRTGHPFRTFPHQPIDHAVEKHLQCPRHIAPITRCPHDKPVSLAYQRQDALGIILWQNAMSRSTALHATRAETDMKIAHPFMPHFMPARLGFLLHRIQHARQVSSTPGTTIYYQYFHFISYILMTRKRMEFVMFACIHTHYYIGNYTRKRP